MDRLLATSHAEFFKKCNEIILQHDSVRKSNKKLMNVVKSKNKFEEKQIEDFVSSYRHSFRTSLDFHNQQKLGKTEQSQLVSIGEMALEITKRDFAKLIISKAKSIPQAKEKLSICYGHLEANNFIERIQP